MLIQSNHGFVLHFECKTILKKHWMNNSGWGMATTTNHGLFDQNFWSK